MTAEPARESLFVYPTAAPDFELSRIEIARPFTVSVDVSGAEILFCARGTIS